MVKIRRCGENLLPFFLSYSSTQSCLLLPWNEAHTVVNPSIIQKQNPQQTSSRLYEKAAFAVLIMIERTKGLRNSFFGLTRPRSKRVDS